MSTEVLDTIEKPSASLTYEYGVRIDPSCDAAVREQIRLARLTYNNLVACMHAVYDDMQTFIIASAGGDAQSLHREIEDLGEQFKAAKVEGDDDRLKAVAELRREKWKQLSTMLAAVRTEHRRTLSERFYSRIGKNSGCETYQLRCAAVRAGLGWATANAVLDAALVSWKTSMKQGKPPRFAVGGEKTQDTLFLQFTAAGGLPAARILSGEHGEIQVSVPDGGAGRRRYGEFLFRLGAASQGVYASGTLQYHRPLPEGATVCMARLVRRRIGNDYRYGLQLVISAHIENLMSAIPRPRKPLLAVYFGWSADVSGRRVAGVTDAADPELARVLQLPPSIEADLTRAQEIQAARDKSRDEIIPKVKSLEACAGWDKHVMADWEKFKRLPIQHVSANRLHHWRRQFWEQDALPEWFASWARADRLQWQSTAHIAKNARNRRKTYYREQAKTWASQYSAILLESIDLDCAAKKLDEKTGEKSGFAKKARSGRVIAALCELESAIRWAAEKNGAAVLELMGEETASQCGICGGNQLQGDENEGQRLHCNDCGAVLDRKKNGAAVAWQIAREQYESLVSDYWKTHLDNQRAADEKRSARKEKMASARAANRAQKMEPREPVSTD